jgi:hypothetical protein
MVKGEPQSYLELLDTTLMGLERSEAIGAFCSHSEASYQLDAVVKKTITYLTDRLKGIHSETWNVQHEYQQTARVLLWLGLMRASLQDLLVLTGLLTTAEETIDLSADLQLFLDGPR